MQPTITRPNRTIVISGPATGGLSFQSGAASKGLTAQQLFNSVLSPSSPSSNQVTPRAPVVHFFVCDYGNAKVKTVSDQFIQLLLTNGINVFTERYATHQPGFQVRATSLNSSADFFFQIHSKTAGRGHVRLYLGGQPRRMTIEESIADIWSWWRLMCGAITQNECDLLSKEKIDYALKHFANLDAAELKIQNLQLEIRKAIANLEIPSELLDQITTLKELVSEGKKAVASHKQVSLEWPREPGAELTRCQSVPIVRGLSQPLRDLLNVMIDQTLSKLQVLEKIIKKYGVKQPTIQPDSLEIPVESGAEGEIPIDGQQPGLSWGALLESVTNESFGSINHITSYGDTSRQSPGSLRPPFFFDDF